MTSDWTTTPITGEEPAALGAKLDALLPELAASLSTLTERRGPLTPPA